MNRAILTCLLVSALLIPPAAAVSAAEVEWRFGSDPGRDGDGGFLLSNTSNTNGEWRVEAESLRFENRHHPQGDQGNFTEAAAVVDLREYGWEPGKDFTLSLEFSMSGVSDWNRLGIVALAPDMGEHEYGEGGFYHGQLRVQSNRVFTLRVADGFGGERPMVSLPLPPSLPDGNSRILLSGTYDDAGGLTFSIEAALEGSDQVWFSRASRIAHPRDGAWFGFGGRIRAYPGARQPILDFKTFRFVPEATEPPKITADLVRHRGTWTHDGRKYPFTVSVRGEFHRFEPLAAAVYWRNLKIPRIGTDPDEAILEDLLGDGLVVIDFDGANLPNGSPDMERSLLAFQRNLPMVISAASNGEIQIDDRRVYAVPSGYRLKRNLPFWNIEKHAVHGTMDRILEVYNNDIVERFGAEPVESVEDMRGRSGNSFDYNLYIDLVYPSGMPDSPVPTIAHFATICPMPGTFRSGDRWLYPIGWLTSGYALALVDHIYHPAARTRYYGHVTNFTLDFWNGLSAGTAAIRFLRAHAGEFNLDGKIGALGHSKSAYSVIRLADPNHVELPEFREFERFPPGSPEPQPWQGFTSDIQVAYSSMGMGVRRTQYTTRDLVPLIIVAGRYDHFGYWNATPAQVARAYGYDLNQLTIWMEELGHTYAFGHDRATGQDRNLLVRRFFDQHLDPLGDDRLKVLAVTPADGAEEVGLDGTTPRFYVDQENLPEDLHGLSVNVPVTVRFARSIDLESVGAEALVLRETATGNPVPGRWEASLRETRFTFLPEESLSPFSEYYVEVAPGIADVNGRLLEDGFRSTFRTRENR